VRLSLFCVSAVVFALAAPISAPASHGPELSAQEQQTLRENFALSVEKLKGPYTENMCVCPDGRTLPVRGADGQVAIPCENPLFCAAYRAPWAQGLADSGMYIGNIFSRDLYLWDSFPDHNDLVRGYILEKYFVDTNPKHRLSLLRGFGGLSGSEYEAPASARFFERYLSAPEFNDTRDFLLAYELQKRFFLLDDVVQIEEVRTLAVRVHEADPKFKPLRDAIHNQMSASVIPQLEKYGETVPAQGAARDQLERLIVELGRLTAVDERALAGQVHGLSDPALQAEIRARLPAADADPIAAIAMLGQLMAFARQRVAARDVSPPDARRLIDLDISAATDVQRRGSALLADGAALTARQYVRLLGALSDAAYGVGLLSARERDAATTALHAMESQPSQSRAQLRAQLREALRVTEWGQANATLAFAEVAAPWQLLLPQTVFIRDDILRGSPLLLYAQVADRLQDFAGGAQRIRHELFGAAVDTDVRALNPGLAFGPLRVAPPPGTFTRNDIVALPETPADLDPAAGILTQGEGNMLSHVQLLARALGIPNVVLGPSAYARIQAHAGEDVFFIVTPGGRVIIKNAAAMSAVDRLVYDEYTRNQKRAADGSLGDAGPRLHIDRAKVDLSQTMPIDLHQVRRRDAGRCCGPKAAYLGELKQLFPDRVARGIVVPFGAYYQHYQNAKVAVPDALAAQQLAKAGEPLPDFVERTYKEFFGRMIPAGTSETELKAWITPRLEIMRYSIGASPLSPELKVAIRDRLMANGLVIGPEQTVGCFVRSDTNVEDLDNFNGAGLNLTVFNRTSLADIYSGLTEVWASPFTLRSFSWRQTLIDDPLWVLSSVVILESVPSEKSGVLVTADPDSGAPGRMLVATSEGVGGAVSGSSAETLLWSPERVELISLFKSPWRNQLLASGGSAVVPASGSDTVLNPNEVQEIVAAGQEIAANFDPVPDPNGKPRPWDIEFGFAAGKLWLFQTRPFLGNDQLRNIPALAPLEWPAGTAADEMISIDEVVR
jgi:hypothetical protein